MSFVSTGEMTRKAQREAYAVPAFNAENLEMAQAIIQAASREGSPVILQTTLPTARYWGMEEAVAVTASLAQEAPVPVALHLDHSNSFDEVMRAARAGYTSLMFDGSAMPYEENLRLTGRVVEAVRPMGLTVEAELGRVGGKEDSAAAPEAALTDPEEARAFAEETGVGLFAPAIGTAHGFYKGEPRLDFALLGEIRGLVSVPLVLHGGSGLPDGMIRRAIGLGIAKVNFATELRAAMTAAVWETMEGDREVIDPKKYLGRGREAVERLCVEKIRLCGSNGRA